MDSSTVRLDINKGKDMVFDHPEMLRLRKKYQNFPVASIPYIIQLDKLDEFKQERDIIEKLFECVNPSVQKDWLGRLLQIDRNQHLGAWFEIMLFGWLKNCSHVEVQPIIENCHPDFLIGLKETKVAIEADAILNLKNDVRNHDISSEIMYLLEKIERPYAINVEIKEHGTGLDKRDMVQRVTKWIDAKSDNQFYYSDVFGNIIYFEISSEIKVREGVGVMLIEPPEVANIDLLKGSLRKKAKQHISLTKIAYPYIIAVFLENYMFTAEELIDAWLGKEQVVIDRKTGQISRGNDQSGLSFHGHEIQNTGVTGILVYKSLSDEKCQTRYLNSWYIENPYARNKIDPNIFPVEGRFIVTERNNDYCSMKWIGHPPG